MSKVVLTRLQEEQLKQALTSLAKTNSIQGEYGVIDFTYDEVIKAAGDMLNNRAYVSVWLNALESSGKLVRIRKGNSLHPSRWDVRQFIAQKPQPEAVKEEAPKTPAPVPVPAPEEASSQPATFLDATKHQVEMKVEGDKPTRKANVEILDATIKEMTTFLKTVSTEMTDYLEDLSADLRGVTSPDVKRMEKQIVNLEKDLTTYKDDNQRLKFQLEMKERELKSKPELKVNKAEIIRQTHLVMDEIERFLGKVPTWSKAGPEHFRAMIAARLQQILSEVGVGGE